MFYDSASFVSSGSVRALFCVCLIEFIWSFWLMFLLLLLVAIFTRFVRFPRTGFCSAVVTEFYLVSIGYDVMVSSVGEPYLVLPSFT